MTNPSQTVEGAKGLNSALRLAIVNLSGRWAATTSPQKQRLLTGTVASLVGASIFLYWAMRPTWTPLYSSLTPEDSRQIASLLTTAGIPYNVTAGGTSLEVTSELLDKARLATAAKVSGKTGRAGFELFDKPNWAGSDFDEKVNYQRALEGELEHTIEAIGDVQSARVHLVLPHDALFMDQQRDAKASVVLKLRGQYFGDEEAESIRGLIASAVDGLKPNNVILVDTNGHSPVGSKDSAADAKTAFEQSLSEHVIRTLEPVAGEGCVRAVVTADFDSSSSDEVDEKYDPTAVVALTMQRSERTAGQVNTPSGVPGTTSNAPNQQTLPLFPNKSSGSDGSKEESGTYGVSKRIVHVVQGSGRLRRINVAVVVDDHPTPSLSKVVSLQRKAWTNDELKQFAVLTQAAVGFDSARGDQVVVQNLRFDRQTLSPPSIFGRLLKGRLPLDPIFRYGTILILSIVFFTFGVRPLLTHVAKLPVSTTTNDKVLGEVQGDRIKLGHGQPSSQLLFEQVADHVQRDPAQSARILQSWIKAE